MNTKVLRVLRVLSTLWQHDQIQRECFFLYYISKRDYIFFSGSILNLSKSRALEFRLGDRTRRKVTQIQAESTRASSSRPSWRGGDFREVASVAMLTLAEGKNDKNNNPERKERKSPV